MSRWVTESGEPLSPEQEAQAEAVWRATHPPEGDVVARARETAASWADRTIGTPVGSTLRAVLPGSVTEAAIDLVGLPVGGAVAPLARRAAVRLAAPAVTGLVAGGLTGEGAVEGLGKGAVAGLAGEGAWQVFQRAIPAIRNWVRSSAWGSAGAALERRISEHVSQELAANLSRRVPELAPLIGEGRPEHLMRLLDPEAARPVFDALFTKANEATVRAIPEVTLPHPVGTVPTTVALEMLERIGTRTGLRQEAARQAGRQAPGVTPDDLMSRAQIEETIRAHLQVAAGQGSQEAAEALAARKLAGERYRTWQDFSRWITRSGALARRNEFGLLLDPEALARYAHLNPRAVPLTRYPEWHAAISFHDPTMAGPRVQEGTAAALLGGVVEQAGGRGGVRLSPGLTSRFRWPQQGVLPIELAEPAFGPTARATAIWATGRALSPPGAEALEAIPVPPLLEEPQ